MATTTKRTAQRPLAKSKPAFVSRLVKHPKFGVSYLIFALFVLAATSLLWTILSAGINMDNADQLADPYLFVNHHSLQLATFPAAHTFLIKWPIFALIAAIGVSAHSLFWATLLSVWGTLAGLAYALSRIERRQAALATIYLAIAGMLLLVPTQPYPGGILPLNMAMLETRNLEYIIYLAALYMLARSPRLHSKRFWAGAVILTLLISSDRLFFGLSLGGAILALVIYAFARSWPTVSLAVRWLLASVVALLGAEGINWLIFHGLHVARIAGGTSPYAITHGLKQIIESTIFAVLGLLSNFGANAAVTATTLKDLPHQLLHHLVSVGGLAYLINLALVSVAVWFVGSALVRNWRRSYKRPSTIVDVPLRLTEMLICSTLAALGLYVFTDHDYVVDGRYLTIGFFALAVGATTVMRTKKWHAERLLAVGGILLIGIALAVPASLRDHHADKLAMAQTHARNQIIAQAMAGRHSDVLVGDYWRVLPIKLASENHLSVVPLSSCTNIREELNSAAWRPNLHTKAFTYLLSLDRNLTNYPRCNLQTIIKAYGRPNASLPVAGSVGQPNELLLFYDHGIHHSEHQGRRVAANTNAVLPISPEELSGTACDGPTIFNIVAHQDDDLLFLNPDLLHDIQAGRCIRTVYLTAGDGGRDSFYWLSRQRGSEAAYATMVHSSAAWFHRTVKLADNEYVTVANMRANNNISLIFLNLPDGNLKGEGFADSGFESLAKLHSGQIQSIRSIDGQSRYNTDQLVGALVKLMHIYQPAEIRSQADLVGGQFPDHSDHIATSRLASQAHSQYEQQQFGGKVIIPFRRYIGYPIHSRPANVIGADLGDKEAAFFAYAHFDGATCHDMGDCLSHTVYGTYLQRQYQEE